MVGRSTRPDTFYVSTDPNPLNLANSQYILLDADTSTITYHEGGTTAIADFDIQAVVNGTAIDLHFMYNLVDRFIIRGQATPAIVVPSLANPSPNVLSADATGGIFDTTINPNSLVGSDGVSIVSIGAGDNIIIAGGTISVNSNPTFDSVTIDSGAAGSTVITDTTYTSTNGAGQTIVLDSGATNPGVSITDLATNATSHTWSMVTAPDALGTGVDLQFRYDGANREVIFAQTQTNGAVERINLLSSAPDLVTANALVATNASGDIGKVTVGPELSLSGGVLGLQSPFVVGTITTSGINFNAITTFADPNSTIYDMLRVSTLTSNAPSAVIQSMTNLRDNTLDPLLSYYINIYASVYDQTTNESFGIRKSWIYGYDRPISSATLNTTSVMENVRGPIPPPQTAAQYDILLIPVIVGLTVQSLDLTVVQTTGDTYVTSIYVNYTVAS